MTPIRTLAIIGTRPEAIKMAPVIAAMNKDPRYETVVCATGQHREMLTPILEWFNISPDFSMDVMTHNQPLASLAGRILSGMQDVITETQPEKIVVQGDTTSAFIAALAGYYNYNFFEHHRVEVAHVEAGLRTYNNYAPYPEEGNRRLIGHIANWHFAPTMTAAEALFEENITGNVFITGNTVIDALMNTLDILDAKPRNPLPFVPEGARVILVTGHRRENYGEGFHNICLALKMLSERFPEAHIVYPVHLNPFVNGPVEETLGGITNIHLVKPMDYPDFVAAMRRAHIILTDSGGVQEEAPSLGKPVLVMRDVTERPDAITAGTVKLVGTDVAKILNETTALMTDELAYNKMAHAVNPYGDGLATRRILNILAGEPQEENTFRVAA